jgi:hypothetical protein
MACRKILSWEWEISSSGIYGRIALAAAAKQAQLCRRSTFVKIRDAIRGERISGGLDR